MANRYFAFFLDLLAAPPADARPVVLHLLLSPSRPTRRYGVRGRLALANTLYNG